ncbi:MAG TPA: hypothetical protein VEC12_06340, partial [Bacteroidia bacterium]|nr:hypothetical protein [Bacteroidia bacterium]
GYHLIRNPWPSNYQHSTTISNLVANTVYVYEGLTVRYYNGTVGTLANGIVPPFHSMLCEVSTNGTTLTLPAANRTTGNNANYFNKSGVINHVAIKVTNPDGIWDEAHVYADVQAQNNKDFWDAGKILNSSEAPSIYTLVNGGKTAINVLNNIPPAGLTVPVNFSSSREGLHTITFSTGNVDADIELFLEDLETGTMHTVSAGAYIFNHSKINGSERFVLHYRKISSSVSVQPVTEKNQTYVYFTDEKLIINATTLNNQSIEIFDLLGRTFYKGRLTGNSQEILLGSDAPRCLLVRVTDGVSTETFKAIR